MNPEEAVSVPREESAQTSSHQNQTMPASAEYCDTNMKHEKTHPKTPKNKAKTVTPFNDDVKVWVAKDG